MLFSKLSVVSLLPFALSSRVPSYVNSPLIEDSNTVVTWGTSYIPSFSSGLESDVEYLVTSTSGGTVAYKSDGSVVPFGRMSGDMHFEVAQKLKSGIKEVFAQGRRFGALTDDGEFFTWGHDKGDLFQPLLSGNVERVIPLSNGFALISDENELAVYGEYSNNNPLFFTGESIDKVFSNANNDIIVTNKDGKLFCLASRKTSEDCGAAQPKLINVKNVSMSSFSSIVMVHTTDNRAIIFSTFEDEDTVIELENIDEMLDNGIYAYNKQAKTITVVNEIDNPVEIEGVEQVIAIGDGYLILGADGSILRNLSDLPTSYFNDLDVPTIGDIKYNPSSDYVAVLYKSGRVAVHGEVSSIDSSLEEIELSTSAKSIHFVRDTLIIVEKDSNVVTWGKFEQQQLVIPDSLKSKVKDAGIKQVEELESGAAFLLNDGKVVTYGSTSNANAVSEKDFDPKYGCKRISLDGGLGERISSSGAYWGSAVNGTTYDDTKDVYDVFNLDRMTLVLSGSDPEDLRIQVFGEGELREELEKIKQPKEVRRTISNGLEYGVIVLTHSNEMVLVRRTEDSEVKVDQYTGVEDVLVFFELYVIKKLDGSVELLSTAEDQVEFSAEEKDILGKSGAVAKIEYGTSDRSFIALLQNGAGAYAWLERATEYEDRMEPFEKNKVLNGEFKDLIGNLLLKSDNSLLCVGNMFTQCKSFQPKLVGLENVQKIDSFYTAETENGNTILFGNLPDVSTNFVEFTNVEKLVAASSSILVLKRDGTIEILGSSGFSEQADRLNLDNVQDVYSSEDGYFLVLSGKKYEVIGSSSITDQFKFAKNVLDGRSIVGVSSGDGFAIHVSGANGKTIEDYGEASNLGLIIGLSVGGAILSMCCCFGIWKWKSNKDNSQLQSFYPAKNDADMQETNNVAPEQVEASNTQSDEMDLEAANDNGASFGTISYSENEEEE